MADETTYYLGIDGQTEGPYSALQIRDGFYSGRFSSSAYVWYNDAWISISDFLSVAEFGPTRTEAGFAEAHAAVKAENTDNKTAIWRRPLFIFLLFAAYAAFAAWLLLPTVSVMDLMEGKTAQHEPGWKVVSSDFIASINKLLEHIEYYIETNTLKDGAAFALLPLLLVVINILPITLPLYIWQPERRRRTRWVLLTVAVALLVSTFVLKWYELFSSGNYCWEAGFYLLCVALLIAPIKK